MSAGRRLLVPAGGPPPWVWLLFGAAVVVALLVPLVRVAMIGAIAIVVLMESRES